MQNLGKLVQRGANGRSPTTSREPRAPNQVFSSSKCKPRRASPVWGIPLSIYMCRCVYMWICAL
eukprot:6526655-Pyramimonas_sp.AAC.1